MADVLTFLRFSPDPALVVDRHGRIVELNDLAGQFFGYAVAELRGQLVELLLPNQLHAIHERHRAGFLERPQTRLMGSGLDLVARHHDGRRLPVEVSLRPFDTEDGLQVVSVIRDIADRERLARTLQVLARASVPESGMTYFTDLLRTLAVALDVSFAFLVEPQDDAPARVVAAYSDDPSVDPSSFTLTRGMPCWQILQDGRPRYYAREVARHFPEATLLAEWGIESYAGVPLDDGTGQVIGALVVMHREPFSQNGLLLALLHTVAARFAADLGRIHLEEAKEAARAETTQALLELAALYTATREINRSLDLGATLENILDAAVRLLGSSTVGIALLNAAGTELTYETARGPAAADVRGLVLKIGEGATGFAASTRSVVNIADVSRDPRWIREIAANRSHLRSCLLVPLLQGDSVVGVLGAQNEVPAYYTPARERLLRGLAEQAALAITHAREVTERAQAEESLHRQALILENVRDSVIVTDRDDIVTYWNAAATALYGHEAEVMVGQSPSRLYLDPDRPRFAAENARILLGHELMGEERRQRKNGELVWVAFQRTPLRDASGEVIGTIGLSQDISKRKDAEEALRHSERLFRVLIEQSKDIVWILNPDGTIRYVSPAIGPMLGYSPDSVVGRNPLDFVLPDSVDLVTERLTQGLGNSGDSRTTRAWVRAGDGSRRLVENTATNLLDEPAIGGVLSTIRDVTEQQNLEEQLRQAQKLEAIGHLAGGIAHDFNNLLTVILGFGELALDEAPPTGTLREELEQIVGAGESASALTRQLLAFSRQQVIAPREVNLNEVVEKAGGMLPRLLGEDLKILMGLAPKLGLARVDPGQIEQVLINLAVNARDAMPNGGTLTIETANVDLNDVDLRRHPDAHPGPHVMLAVSDTGVGMSPEVQARVFEPFFTTKEVGKGTGLGLAAVYGIVKQSGGSILLYSEVGRGTTFKVYFPRVDVATPAAAPPSASATLVRGHETILVVEDDARVAHLARVTLERAGYLMLEARNGEEALEVAAKHAGSIDLVLSDVVMPGQKGPEVVAALRQHFPRLKVIYMSGYTTDRVVSGGVIEHEVDFLQKPFTPDSLSQKVRHALAGSG